MSKVKPNKQPPPVATLCRAPIAPDCPQTTAGPPCRAQVREVRHSPQHPPLRGRSPTAPKPPAPCIGFRYTVLDEIRIDIAKQRAQAYMDRLCRPDPRQWDRRAALMTATRHLWRYG